jgi:hypothetical protein
MCSEWKRALEAMRVHYSNLYGAEQAEKVLDDLQHFDLVPREGSLCCVVALRLALPTPYRLSSLAFWLDAE